MNLKFNEVVCNGFCHFLFHHENMDNITTPGITLFSPDDLLNASHLPIHEADFDAVWVIGRFSENVLDDALGQFAGTLILLQDDEYRHTGFDIGAGLSVHGLNSFRKTVKSNSPGEALQLVNMAAASLRCCVPWLTIW